MLSCPARFRLPHLAAIVVRLDEDVQHALGRVLPEGELIDDMTARTDRRGPLIRKGQAEDVAFKGRRRLLLVALKP